MGTSHKGTLRSEKGENITFEVRSSEESCNKTEMEPEKSYKLGGDALGLIIAPGDVLFVSSVVMALSLRWVQWMWLWDIFCSFHRL